MRKKRKSGLARRQNWLGYLFLAPWLLGFLVFTAGSFLYTLFLSFFDVKLTVQGWERTFVGLNNYMTALLRNTEFGPALLEFMISEVVYVPSIVVIAFIIALLLNRKVPGRTVFRTIYFLPVIVLSGPVMYQLMDTGEAQSRGLEALIVFKIVESYSEPLAEGVLYLLSNFSMVLWFTGIPVVLFLSGLQKISSSIYEAAAIDSATAWQMLWKITIPYIRPVALVVVIFTVIQLSLFSDSPVFTMIQESIYNTIGGYGLASTFAWIYSFVILVLLGIVFLLLREPKQSEAAIRARRER